MKGLQHLINHSINMVDSNSNTEDKKLFYRIGEVTKILDVSSSLLRFWETEFNCLQGIQKNRKGDRLYSLKNIEDLKTIYFLVKSKGYTLQGANEFMIKNNTQMSKQQRAVSSLIKIKSFLEELKDQL